MRGRGRPGFPPLGPLPIIPGQGVPDPPRMPPDPPPMRRNPTLAAVILGASILGLTRAAGPDERPGPAIWPNGPLEVRLAFARAIDPAVARGVVGRTIDFGDGAQAGHL